MKNNNTFLEQHAAFKTGQLEGDAAEQFALQSLRKALIYATNPDIEEDIAYEEFMLQKAKSAHQLKVVARRQRKYAWSGIAASLLLIVGLWQVQTTEPTQQKRWPPLALESVKMGTEHTSEDKLKQAKTHYKEAQYAEALPLFKAFIEADSTGALPYILLAECYAQEVTPNYKKSIEYLEKAQQLDPLYRQQDVVWHLGLAYFYDGQKDKAKTIWLPIQQGRYSTEIQKLLKKM